MSDLRKTAFAVAFSALIAGLLKIGGMARDASVLLVFGVSEQTDALFLATIVSALAWHGLTIGLGTYSLSVLAGIEKDSRSNMRGLVEALMSRAVFLSLVVAGAVFVSAPYIIDRIAEDGEGVDSATMLLRIMVLSYPLSAVSAVQAAQLHSEGRHAALLSVPVVNLGMSIIGVLVAYQTGQIGWFVTCGVGGWVGQVFFGSYLLRQNPSLTLHLFSPSLQGWWPEVFLVAGVVGVGTCAPVIAAYWATEIGVGMLTVYSFSARVINSAVALAVSVVGAVYFRQLVAATTADSGSRASSVAFVAGGIGAGVLVGVLVVGLVGLSIYSWLQGGNFRTEEWRMVGHLVVVMVFGGVASLLLEIWIRIAAAKGESGVALLNALVGTATFFVLARYLSRSFGLTGLAVGWGLGQFAMLMCAAFFLAPARVLPLPKRVCMFPMLATSVCYGLYLLVVD